MVRINPAHLYEIQWKPTLMGHYWFNLYTSTKMGLFIELDLIQKVNLAVQSFNYRKHQNNTRSKQNPTKTPKE
jgi:hypothetical protein